MMLLLGHIFVSKQIVAGVYAHAHVCMHIVLKDIQDIFFIY